MFYSCELLEHHVKMSTEGFGTVYCFLKQIVTNSASEFVFIHIQSKQSVLSSFIPKDCYAERVSDPLFSQWSHLHEKGPLKYCSVSSSLTFPEDWIKGVVPLWSTGFCQVFNLAEAVEGLLLYPPGPVALAYSVPSLSWQQCQLHRSPCRPRMSYNCLSLAHVDQARHNVCYQQDIVSFCGSSLSL